MSLGISQFCLNTYAYACFTAGLFQINVTDDMVCIGGVLDGAGWGRNLGWQLFLFILAWSLSLWMWSCSLRVLYGSPLELSFCTDLHNIDTVTGLDRHDNIGMLIWCYWLACALQWLFEQHWLDKILYLFSTDKQSHCYSQWHCLVTWTKLGQDCPTPNRQQG